MAAPQVYLPTDLLLPALSGDARRAVRLASRQLQEDVDHGVTGIKRWPGTHPLPPALGTKFPSLARLDLSSDTDLADGFALFRALSGATALTSLSLAGCSSLPASFVARQLPTACPHLQHLALTCSCATPPDNESAVMAALAAAPLAAHLTSLELHGSNAFQPELRHVHQLSRLRDLSSVGSRTLDDAALAALPAALPALTRLVLSEQASRRGQHVRGPGVAALSALRHLRALTLACREPEPQRLAAALASLRDLTELDLSKCEPGVLAELHRLVQPGGARGTGGGGGGGEGGGGGALVHLALPPAYDAAALARALPPVLAAAGSSLRALCVEAASEELPAEVVAAMAGLRTLRALQLSHGGLPGAGAAALGTCLTALTLFKLQQGRGEWAQGDADEPGGAAQHGPAAAGAAATPSAAAAAAVAAAAAGTWYAALPHWRALRVLVLEDDVTLQDDILAMLGGALPSLVSLSLKRTAHVSGAGFSAWAAAAHVRHVQLHECSRVGDEALQHLSALPLRSLHLGHLPCVGAVGIRHVAARGTRLAELVLERVPAPREALAELWRLPLLESLHIRMCDVNNQSLALALEVPPDTDAAQAPEPAAGSGSQHAHNTRAADAAHLAQHVERMALSHDHHAQQRPGAPSPSGGGCNSGSGAARVDELGGGAHAVAPPPPAPRLSRVELHGTLVSTSGLRALRNAPGLTSLDLTNSRDVGPGIADLLLYGGSGGGEAEGSSGKALPDGAGTADGAADGASRASSYRRLLPALVHLELRGCPVGDASLQRLRAAGLAVNTGALWR